MQDLDTLGINPMKILKYSLGSGANTLLWHDYWLGDEPLASQFPHLLALDVKKFCLVSERISLNGCC